MAITIPSGFLITTQEPVDSRIILSKAEMLAMFDARMPENYLCLCKDDGELYIYNVNNPIDAETGKFKKFGYIAGDNVQISDDKIISATDTVLEILPVSEYGFDTNLRINQQVNGSALVDKVIELTNQNRQQVIIKSGDYKYNIVSIVNDEILGIKGFAIETMIIPMESLEDIPAIEKGIFLYNPQLGKTCTFYGKEFTSKEIEEQFQQVINLISEETIRAKAAEENLQETLQGEIDSEAERAQEAETSIEENLSIEINRAKEVEDQLNQNKLNVLPKVDDPSDPGFGWEYHIPYNFDVELKQDKAIIVLKTITLDNRVTKMSFIKELGSATQTTAGLMSAADKTKLDHFYAKDLTQDLDDVLILDCNF